ncbi:hypothetical protein SDC9_151372 [bioreactor metagenome]|uniref:Uncharacterized protein n=1 Tax=bioreactor metagenome TaxID=1076179 RepID=A0A645ERQ9_9ZZZZ
MGDKNDAQASGLQIPHDVKQTPYLMLIQRGSRLIEYQHLGVDIHRAGDRDHLLDGNGIAGQGQCDVDIHAHAVHQLPGAAVDRLPVDLPALHGLTANKYILGHCQVGAEVDLLIDSRYPQFLRFLR